MDNQIDLDYIKSVVHRRYKVFIGVFILVMITAVAIAVLLPPVYRSQVSIIVEEQQIPENFVQSTITSYVEQRIETITKQVMSRPNLLNIIQKYNLYRDLADTHTEEEIVAEMRKNISREMWTANIGRINVATIGFTLSYSGKYPEQLQAVANELAYLYIDEEHRSKEKMATVTTDFLQEELDNFKSTISILENKISEFKRLHFGELPENFSGNVQALDRLERLSIDIDREIRTLEERKLYLNSQLSNIEPMTPIMVDGKNVMMNPAERLKRLRLELLSKQTVYSEKHPDILKLRKEIKELEAQVGSQDDSVAMIQKLNDLQGSLAASRGRLGEKHPDVIQMQKEYDALSKELDVLMASQVSSEVTQVKPDNPVYIGLMTQIVTIDSQIEGYRQQQAQIKEEVEDYRKRIENGPVVETEYNELTRDLATTKAKYNDLLGKLMQAKVSQGMESSQRGERFSISEPAGVPGKPYKPNRILILVLGFMLAFGAGTGIVALMEVVDVSLKSPKEVTVCTGLPVFSVFPMVRTDEEIRKAKIRRLQYIVSTVALVSILLVIINYTVMPMDVIWEKTMNRLVEIGIPVDTLQKSN